MSRSFTNTALILAGGRSSRFGSDKAFSKIKDTYLIEHIISQLNPIFDNIIISADNQKKYRKTGLPVFADILKESGPLAGIHSGMKAADADYLFVTACDMPFISQELITHMRAEITKSAPSAVVARYNGFVEPFHAFYSTDLITKIETVLKDAPCGLFAFLNRISPAVIDTDDKQTFININSPEDLIIHEKSIPFLNEFRN